MTMVLVHGRMEERRSTSYVYATHAAPHSLTQTPPCRAMLKVVCSMLPLTGPALAASSVWSALPPLAPALWKRRVT